MLAGPRRKPGRSGSIGTNVSGRCQGEPIRGLLVGPEDPKKTGWQAVKSFAGDENRGEILEIRRCSLGVATLAWPDSLTLTLHPTPPQPDGEYHPTVPVPTQPFSQIIKNYKVVFFDAYGVLKNSRGIIAGVAETLLWLTRGGHDLYVVTNDASKSPDAMTQSYIHPEYGCLLPATRIISSGLLAKDFLRSKVRSGKVAYLGKPASAFYIESAGLEPIPVGKLSPTDTVQAVVMLDDEGFDWFVDLNRTLNLIRNTNVPVVVANTDVSYPVSGNQVAVAVGGLASMIEGIVGKRFIRFGKPDTMMFSYAFACACANDSSISKSDVLMVGDTLSTDIYGANAFGIDTALVLSGNTNAESAAVQISSTSIIPTYVCDSILT